VCRIMTVYGTRPEAIKVAPVIKAVEQDTELTSLTVVTGQHREMLDQVNELFGIKPDRDLDVIRHRQGLSQLAARILERFDATLDEMRPDAVLVQGDTTTSTAAALAAFHRQVPVFHLEAGLRSGDIYSPFPEEMNRRLTSRLAALHLAPTAESRANLVSEGVDIDEIVVTGNTVIDALIATVRAGLEIHDPDVRSAVDAATSILLVTAHRRESWGEALQGVGRALRQIAFLHPDLTIVLPLHRNPVVRAAILPSVEGLANVVICEPLSYADFAMLLSRSEVVLTDSGGIQEEAPSLGKPVLVMRDNTERPEAVEAGTVRLIGTAAGQIVREVDRLLTDRDAYTAMARAVNPYGDGEASGRVVKAVRHFLGMGPRPVDFRAESYQRQIDGMVGSPS
jgi:UDP-N-acetylglucosamine 2-epimerase (non-hydrolysing)